MCSVKRKEREAVRARSRKIAVLRSQATTLKSDIYILSKRKRDRSVPAVASVEDDEAKRLRARMEQAMDDGEGDSAEGSSDGESGDEDGESAEMDDDAVEDGESEDVGEDGSFHTDTDDDDSERLEDMPVDEETKRLHERMQAAMEAAEARAGVKRPAKPTGPDRTEASARTTVGVGRGDDGDTTQWDLGPLAIVGKPLSAAALRAGAAAEAERKLRQAEKAKTIAAEGMQLKKGKRKTKRRKEMQQVQKKIS